MNKNAQSGNNWYQMKLRLLREENNKLKEVISVAAEVIRVLREDVSQLQNEIDVLKQTPAPSPVVKKKKRRWLF